MRFNSLNVSLIRRDELILQLITSRHFCLFCPKFFTFQLVVMSSVTSCIFNSSHYNVLIVSVLSPDVTSDEFLTKTFSCFSPCRHVRHQRMLLSHPKAYEITMKTRKTHFFEKKSPKNLEIT